MLRIGIYGGTFSPPHNGHIASAKAFMEQMWLDVLYIIPTYLPPHKEMDEPISVEDRLAMAHLAFDGMENVFVSDMEIKREGKSYTVDTLRTLDGPDRRLFLLLGTDMVLTLDKWREPAEIFKLSYPCYARREKDALIDKMIVEKLAQYQKDYGKMVHKIMLEPMEISSTDIRKKIKNGESLSNLVPSAVENYIKTHHLYLPKEIK